MAVWGIYRGICTQVVDPEGLGRIKAQVPQVLGVAETTWAWPVSPNIAGIVSLKVGGPVWIAFEGGDPDHPLWLGTWLTLGGALDALPVDISQTALLVSLQTQATSLQSQSDDLNVLHWMTRVTH